MGFQWIMSQDLVVQQQLDSGSVLIGLSYHSILRHFYDLPIQMKCSNLSIVSIKTSIWSSLHYKISGVPEENINCKSIRLCFILPRPILDDTLNIKCNIQPKYIHVLINTSVEKLLTLMQINFSSDVQQCERGSNQCK